MNMGGMGGGGGMNPMMMNPMMNPMMGMGDGMGPMMVRESASREVVGVLLLALHHQC